MRRRDGAVNSARAFALCASVAVLVSLAACATSPAGNTALILAAWEGDSSKVDALLRAGADVNASNHQGTTALMASAWGGGSGNAGVARRLIERGANVNAANAYGRTALMEAARNGNLELRPFGCRIRCMTAAASRPRRGSPGSVE